MRAIIFAAGQSKRMYPLTLNKPKCLLQFGKGTILDHLLEHLENAKINDIVIVTGFERRQIQRHIGNKAKYIVNNKFSSTDSLYSMYLAADFFDDDIVLLNSDVVYDGRIFEAVLQHCSKAVIAVDTAKTLKDGEMNVRLTNGYVAEISKTIPASLADGESAQIAKFDKETAGVLIRETARLIKQGYTDKNPPFAYKPIIEQIGLKAIEVSTEDWQEIDTIENYRKATQKFGRSIFVQNDVVLSEEFSNIGK